MLSGEIARMPSQEPPSLLDESRARQLLENLPSEIGEKIWASRKPAVRFATRRLRPGECLSVGVSRFGGPPDLPRDVPWPTWRGSEADGDVQPLHFVAQLALESLAPHLDIEMPREGTLLFFADVTDATGLFSVQQSSRLPLELRGVRIVHVPAGTPLMRAAPPHGLKLLPEAAVVPMLTWTFEWPDDVDDDLYDALDEFDTGCESRLYEAVPPGFSLSGHHQFGGHARFIQNPVVSEIAASEVEAANPGLKREEAHKKELEEATAWTVVFQFDSDRSLDLCFVDTGTMYWVVPKADLARGDFRNVRYNFQC